MSFNNVVIDTFGRNDRRIHFWSMTKGDTVNRMKNADLSEKKAHNYDYEKNIFIIETSNNILETVTKQYREENRDKCIEKGKQHYEKCNERLQKMARDQYRRLSEKEKDKKTENKTSNRTHERTLERIEKLRGLAHDKRNYF